MISFHAQQPARGRRQLQRRCQRTQGRARITLLHFWNTNYHALLFLPASSCLSLRRHHATSSVEFTQQEAGTSTVPSRHRHQSTVNPQLLVFTSAAIMPGLAHILNGIGSMSLIYFVASGKSSARLRARAHWLESGGHEESGSVHRRIRYFVEFKKRVIDTALQAGAVSCAARMFGVNDSTVRNWLLSSQKEKILDGCVLLHQPLVVLSKHRVLV